MFSVIIGILSGCLAFAISYFVNQFTDKQDPDATITFDFYGDSEPVKLTIHKDVNYLIRKKRAITEVKVIDRFYNSYNDKTDI